jgi:hypothetical protein
VAQGLPTRHLIIADRTRVGRKLVAEVIDMVTPQETVCVLWCRLTGNDPTEFGDDEREAFLARPQVPSLAATPYAVLLDAGITAARRGSLPLERWLAAVRTVRPTVRA